jgi:hypothetical protein
VSPEHNGKDLAMTSENRIAHRAQAAMDSLKKLFERKPDKPEEPTKPYNSWASSKPKTTDPE